MVEKTKVNIFVYDVVGNLVSSISEENAFEAGNHSIRLNTSVLSSGIYYITLDVNGSKETKKLIINQ
jgi:hypothetical protein